MDAVKFTQMKDGDRDDYAFLAEHETDYAAGPADRAAFCEAWDQSSFDPDDPTKPLAFFAPPVRELFGREAYDPAVIRPGVRETLVEAA